MTRRIAALLVLLLVGACTGPGKTQDRRPDMPERPRGQVALDDEAARLRPTVNNLLGGAANAGPLEQIEDMALSCRTPPAEDGYPK